MSEQTGVVLKANVGAEDRGDPPVFGVFAAVVYHCRSCMGQIDRALARCHHCGATLRWPARVLGRDDVAEAEEMAGGRGTGALIDDVREGLESVGVALASLVEGVFPRMENGPGARGHWTDCSAGNMVDLAEGIAALIQVSLNVDDLCEQLGVGETTTESTGQSEEPQYQEG